MSVSSSNSRNAGDSYIGSVVTLVSKYEIRYEGVLYLLNIKDSTLGLKNVRSYGTEGRKKDGPQIPASDKVYEYILFRGSDIKDLQVKSAPPAQTGEQSYNDPAIIQSHIVEAPSCSPAAMVGGTTSESTQWLAIPAVNSRVAPGALASYQTSLVAPSNYVQAALNSAVPSFTSPLHSQGYEKASVGLSCSQMSPLESPLLFTSPMGTHSHLQNHEHQATSMGLGLVNSSETVTPRHSSVALSSMHPNIVSSSAQIGTPLQSSGSLPSPSQPAFVAPNGLQLSSYLSPSLETNSFEAPSFSKAVAGHVVQNGGQVLPLTQTTYSNQKGVVAGALKSASIEVPIACNAVAGTASSPASQTMQPMPHHVSSRLGSAFGAMLIPPTPLLTPDEMVHTRAHKLSWTHAMYPNYKDVGAGSSISASIDVPSSGRAAVDTATKPSLLSTRSMPYDTSSVVGSTSAPIITPMSSVLNPDQIMQTKAPVLPLTRIVYSNPKDVSASSSISAHSQSLNTMPVNQPPLWPLPLPLQQSQYSANQFTEEFDFEAMNEKFRKDEVWGYLGKVKQTDELGGLEDVRRTQGFGNREDHVHGQLSNFDAGPAYKKDDFFDTISCNSLARGARSGQGHFFERMKLDTETFGNFQQRSHISHNSYGRYSAGYGEKHRALYNQGRGYGYGGRGRGENTRI